MDKTFDISYSFIFENNKSNQFNISLHEKDLSIIMERRDEPPPWAKLKENQCLNCTLKTAEMSHCPVAANLADVAAEFRDCFSYENVQVTVTTRERTYSRTTSLQEGLSSLIGIIMVTSGCPVMDKLKPMVRFHLPFATLQETVFRMVSMYLMAQYFRKMEGR
ncbi:MAG TPA: hypothetical protein ENH38_01780, partial [Nitrospirae bacterium]|nr:hypothetical protein [Nitrospirota bacterium]